MRINQYLARCGVCSRRGADQIIESGKVLVDGTIAALGMDITDENEVWVDGKRVTLPENHIVMAYNKPVGVTCTEKDIHAKRKVVDEIQADRRLTYAGRLDKDSEGLLLMTDDGSLIDAMMRGSNFHEKEYVVKVNKPISDTDIAKLCNGIYLKELEVKTRPCKIKRIEADTFSIILTQGLNRQIRRMCEAVGYKVTVLKRTRVMNICLSDLQVGASRQLTKTETDELYKLCNIGK